MPNEVTSVTLDFPFFTHGLNSPFLRYNYTCSDTKLNKVSFQSPRNKSYIAQGDWTKSQKYPWSLRRGGRGFFCVPHPYVILFVWICHTVRCELDFQHAKRFIGTIWRLPVTMWRRRCCVSSHPHLENTRNWVYQKWRYLLHQHGNLDRLCKWCKYGLKEFSDISLSYFLLCFSPYNSTFSVRVLLRPDYMANFSPASETNPWKFKFSITWRRIQPNSAQTTYYPLFKKELMHLFLQYRG